MTTDGTDTSATETPHGGRRAAQPDAVDTRGRSQFLWDLLFPAIRGIGTVAKNFYATLGIFLLAGASVAIAGTYAFARFASHVRSGRTQAFDEAVLRWIAEHRSPTLEPIMLELTFLGTGIVVMTIVAVSAMFLALTNHRYSAVLLLISTAGGLVLNSLLKMGFGRPRPQIFDWGTHVVSSSFPSGHAMGAAVAYGTVAYLAARLQKSHSSRVLTMLLAAAVIVLIAITRLYLGVHYPSDVFAGIIIGLAWAAFCMATLEAFQVYARRRAPLVIKNEDPPPVDTAPARSA
jgi:undecaprenyl-diphosphatase